jgi:hypothetical protein
MWIWARTQQEILLRFRSHETEKFTLVAGRFSADQYVPSQLHP